MHILCGISVTKDALDFNNPTEMQLVKYAMFCVVLVASSIAASSGDGSGDDAAAASGNPANIFPPFANYDKWAICVGKVTKKMFPHLQAPTAAGGCVRYYQGIDMTGVVTEKHFFAKVGFFRWGFFFEKKVLIFIQNYRKFRKFLKFLLFLHKKLKNLGTSKISCEIFLCPVRKLWKKVSKISLKALKW